ncbi:hypothetical protein L1787_04770 [Acuticoccus sp. M5D2P5]|uniref:hypothetical protein n=1 Tax=Acuticoccus kalidii TaxID=2910977 RepID=UPI001F406A4E|nr:hypothetical protein [Acuticoccus kalidii]MCF3932728.1 hypothetical protein [Acuticoccus kalidii]
MLLWTPVSLLARSDRRVCTDLGLVAMFSVAIATVAAHYGTDISLAVSGFVHRLQTGG